MELTMRTCSRADHWLTELKDRCLRDDHWPDSKKIPSMIDSGCYDVRALLRYDHGSVERAAYWYFERRTRGRHRYTHDERGDWFKALDDLGEPVGLLFSRIDYGNRQIEVVRVGASEPRRGYEKHLMYLYASELQERRTLYRRLVVYLDIEREVHRPMFENVGFETCRSESILPGWRVMHLWL